MTLIQNEEDTIMGNGTYSKYVSTAVDEDTFKKIKEITKEKKISVYSWVRELILREITSDVPANTTTTDQRKQTEKISMRYEPPAVPNGLGKWR